MKGTSKLLVFQRAHRIGSSIWIDRDRPLWVLLLSNRIHPTRENGRLRDFRPILHDAIYEALETAETAV